MNSSQSNREPNDLKLVVDNLQRMIRFYCGALGFELIGERPNAALLEFSDPAGGPIQAIGLFKRPVPAELEHQSRDRGGATISLNICGIDGRRVDERGLQVRTGDPRRICFSDPEGNHVELICHGGATDCR